MSTINYDLNKIKAFIFDVDGVLSPNIVPVSEDGVPIRMANVKDGYAIYLALRHGYGIAIMTGGDSEAVRKRFSRIGVKDIYMRSRTKTNDLKDYLSKTGYSPEEITYIGDDIPDYQVMQSVGLAVAPADAAHEIKSIAQYISHYKGGEGVARDVIEQVLKAQGKWMGEEAFSW